MTNNYKAKSECCTALTRYISVLLISTAVSSDKKQFSFKKLLFQLLGDFMFMHVAC
jgi:hypothetical protein